MSREYQLNNKNKGWMQSENQPPLELILEKNQALAVCFANDIEQDKVDVFPQGLARVVMSKERLDDGDSMGCLCTWALGLKLITDYLNSCKEIDNEKIVVSGCSRLGKAALWYGACDERIYCTVSFNSGCGGAALSRGKKDETISQMLENFPHWLCNNMKKYSGNENKMPFDQNALLGLVAPRLLYVTSSTEDPYSDPYGEFLGCVYANEAYEQYHITGIQTEEYPDAGCPLQEGAIGYHLRQGEHGVKRYDWECLLEFLERKQKS